MIKPVGARCMKQGTDIRCKVQGIVPFAKGASMAGGSDGHPTWNTTLIRDPGLEYWEVGSYQI